MAGSTELGTTFASSFAFIAALCVASAISDALTGRIFNWLTLPALALGIAWSAAVGGLPGFVAALAGAGLGLAAFGWMFFAGAMGGGDVKLLMALGAWGGPRYAVEVALASIMLGGALALVVLVYKGRIRSFAGRMHHFLLTLTVKELEREAPRLDHSLNLPFGVPIAIAGIWVAWGDPYQALGIRLW